ncbi:hypothetical protein N599_30690 [Saccharopolyspora erythraea D]|nr:hypothetical protein N599_30690 [Saccharopolyspora erythraea D]
MVEDQAVSWPVHRVLLRAERGASAVTGTKVYGIDQRRRLVELDTVEARLVATCAGLACWPGASCCR